MYKHLLLVSYASVDGGEMSLESFHGPHRMGVVVSRFYNLVQLTLLVSSVKPFVKKKYRLFIGEKRKSLVRSHCTFHFVDLSGFPG